MIYEQLSKKWLSDIQNKKKCFEYLVGAVLAFWLVWYLYFFVQNSLWPFAELEVYKAELFKKGFIPYRDFEDYKWPGRYILYYFSLYFPDKWFLSALNFGVIIFWGKYCFQKLKQNQNRLFFSVLFLLLVLSYQATHLSLQWFLSPILIIWLDPQIVRSSICRSVLTLLSFILMPSLALLYVFFSSISRKEKAIHLFVGILLMTSLLYGMSTYWQFGWDRVLSDFYLFWRQNAELGEINFLKGLRWFVQSVLSLLFSLRFLIFPFLFFFIWAGRDFRFVSFGKRVAKKYFWIFLALLIYPALTFKFFLADYFFLFSFLIFISLKNLFLIRKERLSFEFLVFIFVVLCALGAKSFSGFYFNKEYVQAPYDEVKKYLKSVVQKDDKILIYAGGELEAGFNHRLFLLHRDLDLVPFTSVWNKFSLFHHINEPYQKERGSLYIHQVLETHPRYILVPPIRDLRPNGKNTISDFYMLMEFRTQQYRRTKLFETVDGPISLYERL